MANILEDEKVGVDADKEHVQTADKEHVQTADKEHVHTYTQDYKENQ